MIAENQGKLESGADSIFKNELANLMQPVQEMSAADLRNMVLNLMKNFNRVLVTDVENLQNTQGDNFKINALLQAILNEIDSQTVKSHYGANEASPVKIESGVPIIVQNELTIQENMAKHEFSFSDTGEEFIGSMFHKLKLFDQLQILNKMNSDLSSPLKVQQLIDQIAKTVKIIQHQGRSEMTIQLKPDLYGRMSLRLSVEDGAIKIKIVVDKIDTQKMIENNITHLQKTLAEHGLKIDKLDVTTWQNFQDTKEAFSNRTGFRDKNPSNGFKRFSKFSQQLPDQDEIEMQYPLFVQKGLTSTIEMVV